MTLYDMLLPESPYVFYDINHGFCINTEDVLNLIEQLQLTGQWIPCSERLPEETRKSYWICTDAGYQCECRWTNINHLFTDLTMKWHWHIMDVPQYDSVVAWMPLPEPYKEGET